MFDYDWFHGNALQQQQEEAKLRCALSHFPHLTRDDAAGNADFRRFLGEVEVRRLVYLRDGFSYEIRELAHVPSKSQLSFECEPVDDHYKVGSFVVSVPFDEIVRVEVFAVHPAEKPEDMPQITGFRSRPERNVSEDSSPPEPPA
jgi:hypothetical protein